VPGSATVGADYDVRAPTGTAYRPSCAQGRTGSGPRRPGHSSLTSLIARHASTNNDDCGGNCCIARRSTIKQAYLGTPIGTETSPCSQVSLPEDLPSVPASPWSWIDTGTQTSGRSPPARHDTGTQTSVWWSPTRHARRRIFEPHLRRLDLYPPVTERFGSMVDTRRARRLCDCRRCVQHMLRLVKSEVTTEAVTVPGIRFLQLPGLTSIRSSSTEDRSALGEELHRHPGKLLIGCGCRSCTAHRELAQAWTNTLSFKPVESRERQ